MGLTVLGLCAGGQGLAATAVPSGPAFYHRLVREIARTLGATEVSCNMLGADATTTGGQATCARLPGLMFGYFETGVSGRLYAYLEQGTVRVRHPWGFRGTTLEVVYELGRKESLTVARVWRSGQLYAVFTYSPGAAEQASVPSARPQ